MTELRVATEADFDAITAVYAWNVENGTGTFALEPPSHNEMLAGYRSIVALRLPYLVALENGVIVGYAYASPFRPRPGYKYGVEDSVYLAETATGRGLGKLLIMALIEACMARGIYKMIAVVGDGDNGPSIGVHKACGFRETGRLPGAGFKFGRWLDVVFMMRDLLPATDTPQGDGWAGQD